MTGWGVQEDEPVVENMGPLKMTVNQGTMKKPISIRFTRMMSQSLDSEGTPSLVIQSNRPDHAG